MRSPRFFTAALGLFAVLVFLGATESTDEVLTCKTIPKLWRDYLSHHIRFHELSAEIKVRAADLYVKRSDPSRVLFLQEEAEDLKRTLPTFFEEAARGNCGRLLELNQRVVSRYKVMEDFVRKVVSAEDYAVDYETELILDPEKRGFPKSNAERDVLHTDLIHFQMSNYLVADEKLAEAKSRLIHRYELMTRRASEQDAEDIYSLFLDSFAGALDPHSNYLPREELEEFHISMGLSLEGIGVALSSRDGYSVVERVIPGGAADRQALLRSNDKIIAVAQGDGKPVDVVDMALRDVVRMIRGRKGTPVKLTVLRQGETTERFEVTILRDTIDLDEQAAKLRWETLERGEHRYKLAILDLPSFYGDSDPSKRDASSDVAKLLRQVRKEKADGLVLDLSRNGGGLLQHAVQISGFFLGKGNVVAVQDVNLQTKVLPDPDPGIQYAGPLLVLVSRISASASEILAGALQDYQRAVIAGDDHTFGKGTVQTVVTLPKGLGAMKVTTGIFYLPGGASTQHAGVASHVSLPSFSSTQDLGERFQPYALKGRRIEPFLRSVAEGGLFSSNESSPPLWKPVTPRTATELARRSTARVAADADFNELQKRIAEAEEKGDVVQLAELKKSQAEAKAEGGEPAVDGGVAVTKKSAAIKKEAVTKKGAVTKKEAATKQEGAQKEAAGRQEKAAKEEPTAGKEAGAAEGRKAPAGEPLTPQAREALQILVDWIELVKGNATTAQL